MYTLIPTTFLGILRAWREMNFDALEGTQTIARRIVRDMPRGAWAAFESQALSLLVGGVVPLLGNLLFGWPAFLVIAGIAIDNAAQWLSDVLKPLLNRKAFWRQFTQQCDAADAIGMAQAVCAPSPQRDGMGTPLYNVVQRLNRFTPYVSRDYLRMGFFVCLMPPFWIGLYIAGNVPEASRAQILWILLVPVLVRVAIAAVAVSRRDDSRSRSFGMLPQAPEPLAAFYVALLAYLFAGLTLFGNHPPGPWYWGYEAVAFFSIYLTCSVAIAIHTMREMRRSAAALRAFAAMTPEQLYAIMTPGHRKRQRAASDT